MSDLQSALHSPLMSAESSWAAEPPMSSCSSFSPRPPLAQFIQAYDTTSCLSILSFVKIQKKITRNSFKLHDHLVYIVYVKKTSESQFSVVLASVFGVVLSILKTATKSVLPRESIPE